MRKPSKTSLFSAAKRWDEASVAATLAKAPQLSARETPSYGISI